MSVSNKLYQALCHKTIKNEPFLQTEEKLALCIPDLPARANRQNCCHFISKPARDAKIDTPHNATFLKKSYMFIFNPDIDLGVFVTFAIRYSSETTKQVQKRLNG